CDRGGSSCRTICRNSSAPGVVRSTQSPQAWQHAAHRAVRPRSPSQVAHRTEFLDPPRLAGFGPAVRTDVPSHGRACSRPRPRRYDNHPVYDMVYVAVAEAAGVDLITADESLRSRLGHFGWIKAPDA